MPLNFTNNGVFNNIPTPPRTDKKFLSFPNDLTADGRNFCSTFQFMAYGSQLRLGNLITTFTRSGAITLPIPEKLNDQQNIDWSSSSATSTALNMLGSGKLGDTASAVTSLISYGTGYSINPHLWMQFKSPALKEHQFSWTLTPNNEQESRTISEIINKFKYASLPTEKGYVLYEYPSVVMVALHPDEKFLYKFKPCIIKSVSVDYNGAGSPSFFKNTNAPTVIKFSIELTEIQVWTKNNFYT